MTNFSPRTFFSALALTVLSAAVCFAEEDGSREAGNDKPGVIHLTRENLEHAAMKTQAVYLGNLSKALRVPGRVSANANKTAVITSTLEGRVQRLNFDIGDKVHEGEVLALVESPELIGKPLSLRSPIGGMVIDRTRSVGETAGKETPIYTVSDPSTLWVIAEIRESDLALVHDGQDASFTVLSYPDRKFRGRVERIGSQVEMKSRTVEVRITAANADGLLKPGMFADVEVVTTVIHDVPLVSDAALQTDGSDQIAFVEQEPGEFEKRVVTIGHEYGGVVQIQNGLAVGDKVVTEGSFILKSEMLKGEMGED